VPDPDAQALDELGQAPQVAGRLRKAPSDDPVLSASSPSAGSATEVNPPKAAAIRPVRRPAAGRVAASDRVTSTAGKAKVGFYQAPDDTARARAAYDWTRPQEGHRSFSDFISAAVMREVARLETTSTTTASLGPRSSPGGCPPESRSDHDRSAGRAGRDETEYDRF